MLGRSGTARSAPVVVGALAILTALLPLGLLVSTAWSPLVRLDAGATDAAERAVAGSPWLLAGARVVTLAGDPSVLWLLTVAAAATLAATGHRRLAVFVLVVRLGAQLISTGAKQVFDRARPVFEQPVDTALGAAFPSGHVLGAAAVWTGLAVLALALVGRRIARLLLGVAVVIAVAVAASRVLLGVHHLTDVVAGLLLGGGWTALCAAALVVGRHGTTVPGDRR